MNVERPIMRQGAIILGVTVLANIAIVVRIPGLSLLAAVLLLYLLPGLALLGWVAPGASRARNQFERFVLGGGLSITLSTVSGILLHYVPGPMPGWSVLLSSDLLVCAFMALAWRRGRRRDHADRLQARAARQTSQGLALIGRPAVLILLGLLVLTLFYRFTFLGYSEFQGDEALVMWSSARAISGEDDILFLHGKSPAEIVLPATLWVLNGPIDEFTARIPFAIAGVLSALGVFMLARRAFGQAAGWLGLLLFAINGYFIGFARVVQYQSLVLVMSILAVYCGLRALDDDDDTFQVLSALFLGAGLLAHYDTLLTLPVILFLWAGRLLKYEEKHHVKRWLSAAGALALVAAIAAIYYVPLVLDARFGQMFSYLSGSRVGENLFNNHLVFLLLSGTVYNSSYYTVVLVIVLLAVWWWLLRKVSGAPYVSVVLFALILSTALWPAAWQVGGVNLAVLPFALAWLLAWLLVRNDWGLRAIWLWFGVTAVFYVFVLALPLSHVYTIMPAWILLVALGLSKSGRWMWHYLAVKRWRKAAAWVGLAVCLIVLAYYPYLVFVRHAPEFTQAYKDQAIPLYWRPYSRLPEVGLFGFPHLSGWKAVGYLYDTGKLKGEFRGNEEEWVMLWYTHFAPYSCQPDGRYYFIATNPWDSSPIPEGLLESEYEQLGAVQYEGNVRLRIYEHRPAVALNMNGDTAQGEPVVNVSDIERLYDKDAEPQRFVQRAIPKHELKVDFDRQIRLLGYDLDQSEVTAGSRVGLTLYWQAGAPVSEKYHVFAQIGDEIIWGQSDSEPVCNRLPTPLWRPGQVVIDRHRIDISLDAPAGEDHVYAGLYSPETGERLEPQTWNDGTNRVILTELEIRSSTGQPD